MLEEYIERIHGEKFIMETIQPLIGTQALGKIEIPGTQYSWITTISEIRKIGNSSFLTIERTEGFDPTLSCYLNQEVSLEFMTEGGVPCRFRTKIVELHPDKIQLDLPGEIYRIQKRQYFRINALLGTKITFRIGSSEEKKAEVRDFSEGGAAFFIEKEMKLSIGDLLNDVSLNIPGGNEKLIIPIPQTAVRRIVQPSFPDRRILCALEFLKISKENKNKLADYISKQQMVVIQKLKG